MSNRTPNNPNPDTHTNIGVGKKFIIEFVERYQSWSRPMRFFLWVAIVLIAYFGIISPSFTRAHNYRAAADSDQQRMIDISRSTARNRSIIEKSRKQWGNLTLPDKGTDESGAALQKVITTVLNKYGIRSGITIKDIGTEELQGSKSKTRTRSSRSSRNRNRAADDTFTLLQTKTQVQFTASPDVLSAVLAELEKNQKVAAIQRVSITADTRRPVLTVILVVQSWYRT